MTSWRTTAAKTVFILGGLLSRVQTYQRVYAMNWDGPKTKPEFTPAGRRWLSCSASMKLMHLSERIDPGHWEHWALSHEDCPAIPCPRCGGQLCPDDEDQ
jgi:hypothetical protein